MKTVEIKKRARDSFCESAFPCHCSARRGQAHDSGGNFFLRQKRSHLLLCCVRVAALEMWKEEHLLCAERRGSIQTASRPPKGRSSFPPLVTQKAGGSSIVLLRFSERCGGRKREGQFASLRGTHIDSFYRENILLK